MKKADKVKVGMSVEQLIDLRETAKHIGIELMYDVKKGQWNVNPAVLMAAFCQVADIPEDKGKELWGKSMGLIVIQTIIDDISKGFIPDE